MQNVCHIVTDDPDVPGTSRNHTCILFRWRPLTNDLIIRRDNEAEKGLNKKLEGKIVSLKRLFEFVALNENKNRALIIARFSKKR